MKTATFICTHCSEEYPIDERIMVGMDALCPDCADEITVVCEHCGERIYADDSVSDSNMTLCQSCFDQFYTRCVGCDAILRSDEAIYDDDSDDAYCSFCWHEMQEHAPVHEYSFKPDPIFYGEGERFFGVELEIDGNGKSFGHAQQILETANEDTENLYIKSDGSLDCGLELVTHPMTLAYHMNEMPWGKVLRKALDLGYLSHRTTTCGLHVHISRSAFGDTLLEQECCIARLLYFVEKFWTELLRFSRRTERQMNRWAARYGMKLSPQEIMDSAKDSCAGRYTAVNLTNYKTVEIRIFRGTLKLNTLLATLQLVNAICDVALFLSDEELQALSWHGFLDRVHEPELIQYLKERNLYKNEPVTYEEDN